MTVKFVIWISKFNFPGKKGHFNISNLPREAACTHPNKHHNTDVSF